MILTCRVRRMDAKKRDPNLLSCHQQIYKFFSLTDMLQCSISKKWRNTSQSGVKLGFNLYKVRVASPGKGKRGAFRTIVIYISSIRAIYVFGFSKNELDNISKKELEDFKNLARTYTDMDETDIEKLLNQNAIFELEE